MSTATVLLSLSTAGLSGPALTLLNRTDKPTCNAQCLLWTGRVVNGGQTLCSSFKFSCGVSELSSKWTGSESRFGLQASPIPRAANHGNHALVVNGSLKGGLIPLRQRSREGRVNPNLVHQMYSSGPLRNSAVISPSVSDTRIAYGYFLGPVYGYGGGFGGGSLLLIIVLGFIAVQAFQSLAGGGSRGALASGEKVSVLKLQVGLLGFARTVQTDLERIADRADTSTSRGLHYVLTETVLALLRQRDKCVLGTSSSEVKRGVEAGERRFNQVSLEERGKFDEETLVNVDGNRKKGQGLFTSDGLGNEYIVVTLLVAAEGDYKLPNIYDSNSLKESLEKLGSIPAENIQGVEILWTPQDMSDTLSERDLLRNYPLLRSL